MFEASLKEKLKRIFDFDKVSFAIPSESQEQEGMFIQVDQVRSSIKDARQVCKVQGKLIVYASNEKLPYGYFSKKIQEAELADTRDLYFYDFEGNAGRYQDISERSLGFIYFFNSQYNPDIGSITSINLEQE